MRTPKAYHAFCSADYLWLMYGAIPAAILLISLLFRVCAMMGNGLTGAFSIYIPMLTVIIEAVLDENVFGGICGKRAVGTKLLMTSCYMRQMVMRVCAVDMLRRMLYVSLAFLLPIFLSDRSVAADYLWAGAFPDDELFMDVLICVVGLYAVTQLAVVIARHFLLRTSNMICGISCLLLYFFLRYAAFFHPMLGLAATMIMAIAISVFTYCDLAFRIRRMYHDE